ncbi:helix-turn-helix domain-containing protein [Sporosarcina sp. FSL K6-2383]|uniref:MarR family transcriptional regulator n=1 Tax=Sporosarcina sp. FSL K6-2383 TaxID=2921556 RepID=UPI003159FFCA
MGWIKQHETFTSKELENYLDRSKSSVRQLITELVASNLIEHMGCGHATKYRVKLRLANRGKVLGLIEYNL